MKKTTTTTPDPELSTPLGSENEVNANAPRTPQARRRQDGKTSTESAGANENKARQQSQGDVCGKDGACI
jgi:hypothetical protein